MAATSLRQMKVRHKAAAAALQACLLLLSTAEPSIT
jgi:hypothetical protein